MRMALCFCMYFFLILLSFLAARREEVARFIALKRSAFRCSIVRHCAAETNSAAALIFQHVAAAAGA